MHKQATRIRESWATRSRRGNNNKIKKNLIVVLGSVVILFSFINNSSRLLDVTATIGTIEAPPFPSESSNTETSLDREDRPPLDTQPKNITTDTPPQQASSPSASFLQDLISNLQPKCDIKPRRIQKHGHVAYLAIARTGSTSLSAVFGYHFHDCTLRDLEERGATRVLISLRHPIARISSGVSRRLEGNGLKKNVNKLFYDHFKTPDEYIQALAHNSTDYKHTVAQMVTIGHNKQNYMTPVTEFYLANSLGTAEVAFVCIESFEQDFEHAFSKWKIPPPRNMATRAKNTSIRSSANVTEVAASRFSPQSVEWMLKTYAADVALYEKHCGVNRGETETQY